MKALVLSIIAAFACLVAAEPGRAQTFGLVGEWRGEGAMVSEEAGAERLRCRMTGATEDPLLWTLHIRCAKLQGQLEMWLSISKEPNGILVGQGEVKGEKSETAELSGRLFENSLRVETKDGARVELVRREDALLLQAWGNATQGGFIQVRFPM